MAVKYTGNDPSLFLRKTREELVAILNEEASQLESELVSETPADRGGLRQGWTMRAATLNNLTAIVGQSKAHFLPTEMGRKPGTGISQVGQQAVQKWFIRKLGGDSKEAPGFAYNLSQKYIREGRPAQGFAGLAKPGDPAPTGEQENLEPVGGPILAGFRRLRRRLS